MLKPALENTNCFTSTQWRLLNSKKRKEAKKKKKHEKMWNKLKFTLLLYKIIESEKISYFLIARRKTSGCQR